MRVFISHIFPKDKILKYGQSMAANLFCYNLIDSGAFDKIYSILPAIEIDPKDMAFNNTNINCIFSPARKIKFGLKLSFIFENIKIACQIPRKSAVWFYNLPTLSVILFWILKIFKPSVSLNVIILDYTPGKKGINGLIEKILLHSINKANGTIKLANSHLFTCQNSICLPGIVPSNMVDAPMVKSIKPSFLISGTLTDTITMMPLLLETFSKLPNAELHITGKYTKPKLIKQYTTKFKNIIYHGMVSYDEYLKILHNIPFLLSTRQPSAPENQCNFPSKIIEALLHNRIVISTIHYPQIDGIKYFEVGSTISQFISDIKKITTMPNSDLLSYANQGNRVRLMFNSNIWKTAMEKIENKLKQ